MSEKDMEVKSNDIADEDIKNEKISDKDLDEVKNDKEKKVFMTILQTTKEMIIRGILFCIVYLVINRFYKIFSITK